MKITAGTYQIPAHGIIEGSGGVQGVMCDTVQIMLPGLPDIDTMTAIMTNDIHTDDGRTLAGYRGLAAVQLTLYREPQDAKDLAMQNMTAQMEAQAQAQREAQAAAQAALTQVAEMTEERDEYASRLVSPPAQGAQWDAEKRYIQGDEATQGGKTYTAKRFSRGKQPDLSPEHWQEKAVPVTVTRWEDDPSAHPYVVGDLRTYDLDGDATQRKTYRCKKDHTKSTIRKPQAISDHWEAV